MLYDLIKKNMNKEKMISLLIDPDNHDNESLENILHISTLANIDFLLVGGSIVTKSFNEKISIIKKKTSLPVFLFPGNLLQLCDMADGILFLSLLSGRNPELLIGNHVIAAPFIKNSGIEVIPTGYILIDTGTRTSVEYMSNTRPIPSNKPEIAVATAMAGEMLGHKLIYLEGGSGAEQTVCNNLIEEVKKNISIPLVVGGGIRTAAQTRQIFSAGADIIVISTVAEESPDMVFEIVKGK
ncbi:MAG TPA: geranylgeranylglyceryl/heptaprenylglyceryl phosphate synthase [Bacteroidales bacterium]